jgi:Protein of unknown function (DUF2985)
MAENDEHCGQRRPTNGATVKEEEAEVTQESSRTATTTTTTATTCTGSSEFPFNPNSPVQEWTTPQQHQLNQLAPTSSSSELRQEQEQQEPLDPPRSKMEQFRDSILRTLDLPLFQYMGLMVLLGVIVDGALFFFLLVGWHTLCTPRTDCEPRNTLYNISVQILNGFFTYMAILSLPWRMTNLLHLTQTGCPSRSNAIGCNLYGQPDLDLWFHIPLRRRLYITIILLWNCFFQFINHATRFVFLSYDEQNVKPGNIWTNVFFVAAFVCAGVGGIAIAIEAATLRQQQPGTFGYGPMDTIQHLYRHHVCRWVSLHCSWKKKCDAASAPVVVVAEIDSPQEEDYEQTENAFHHHERLVATTDAQHQQQQHDTTATTKTRILDPTREAQRRSVLLEDRGALRMFGM